MQTSMWNILHSSHNRLKFNVPDDRPDGVAELELVCVGGGGEVLAELGHDCVEVLKLKLGY